MRYAIDMFQSIVPECENCEYIDERIYDGVKICRKYIYPQSRWILGCDDKKEITFSNKNKN